MSYGSEVLQFSKDYESAFIQYPPRPFQNGSFLLGHENTSSATESYQEGIRIHYISISRNNHPLRLQLEKICLLQNANFEWERWGGGGWGKREPRCAINASLNLYSNLEPKLDSISFSRDIS